MLPSSSSVEALSNSCANLPHDAIRFSDGIKTVRLGRITYHLLGLVYVDLLIKCLKLMYSVLSSVAAWNSNKPMQINANKKCLCLYWHSQMPTEVKRHGDVTVKSIKASAVSFKSSCIMRNQVQCESASPIRECALWPPTSACRHPYTCSYHLDILHVFTSQAWKKQV